MHCYCTYRLHLLFFLSSPFRVPGAFSLSSQSQLETHPDTTRYEIMRDIYHLQGREHASPSLPLTVSTVPFFHIQGKKNPYHQYTHHLNSLHHSFSRTPPFFCSSLQHTKKTYYNYNTIHDVGFNQCVSLSFLYP
ncbi:hypothetical protein F4778DRAFT_737931 [Xylariomycetidae sp. FL2044]|nr:hypothetical protein F4778DRAFT_737931 [Xylariomycetidae sp. FL2044]